MAIMVLILKVTLNTLRKCEENQAFLKNNVRFEDALYINKCLNYIGIIPTVCPRISDPFYTVTYRITWVTTSWTYSSLRAHRKKRYI